MRTDLYYCKYKLSVINNLDQKLVRQIKQDKTTRRNTQTNVSNRLVKGVRIYLNALHSLGSKHIVFEIYDRANEGFSGVSEIEVANKCRLLI